MEIKELQNKYGFIIERDWDGDSDNYLRYVIKNQDGIILKDGVYAYRLEAEVKKLYGERVKKDRPLITMITEDYVSFETAKLLKEKGFNEDCYTYYDDIEDSINRFDKGYHFN